MEVTICHIRDTLKIMHEVNNSRNDSLKDSLEKNRYSEVSSLISVGLILEEFDKGTHMEDYIEEVDNHLNLKDGGYVSIIDEILGLTALLEFS